MTNDPTPSSKLIFVNKSEADYQELSFSFVAKSGPLIYQHNKRIQIPKQSIAIANLTDIPIEAIEANEDGTITASIRRCYVIIKGIKSADEELDLDIRSEEYHFSHTTLLNGKWKRKWGINWNLDLLESKKRDLWSRTYWKYITQHRQSVSFIFSQDGSSFSTVEHVNPIFRITKPFCRLINWEPLLTLRFWTLLLLGRIELSDDSDKSK
jgi:hypothetical protein